MLTQRAIFCAIELAQFEIDFDPSGGAEDDPAVPAGADVYVDPGVTDYDITDHPNLTEEGILGVYDEWLGYALRTYSCSDVDELLHAYAEQFEDFDGEDRKYLDILSVWAEDDLAELPPIAVRQTGTILDGWHRLVVAVSQGQTTDIPAVVVRW
jgi:hypothetical protein